MDTDRSATRPEQPDGIDDHSYDLPSPKHAVKRIHEFLTEYGDGLIEPKVCPEYEGTMPPLYARDLQALANEADR
ncbi:MULTISPECIES: hypothetical protein [Prauserella salsuginis group]|uniref:Uncharacterized protein n=1 Tax=Prauserella salsuginis TaxID=387889 RepID=A0ABW6G5T1_9PSEU|nr:MULTISPECIES: hypothetical protein [Prauserella salsuginis group]MCR3719155.1 hypothetical protein [Prauserella flava]MCR3735832.1 hypothetical protein [Prauserella salsuginis]